MRFVQGIECLILFLFLQGHVAAATEFDLLSSIEKKQSIISGVLNPASISINGEEIFSGSQKFQALLFNGDSIPVKKVGGLETFYFSTDKSDLQLEWLTEKNEKVPLIQLISKKLAEFKKGDNSLYYKVGEKVLALARPELLELKTDGKFLFYRTNQFVQQAKMDGKDLDLNSSQVEIPNFKGWLNEYHSLELLAQGNVGQIYNLDFRDRRKELLTKHSIALWGFDSFFGSDLDFRTAGMAYRKMNEKNVSVEWGIGLSQRAYDVGWSSGDGSNHIEQRFLQLIGKWGYDYFDTTFGTVDYRRLTLGVVGEVNQYYRWSKYATTIEGPGQARDRVELYYLSGGFFFRWEPIQLKNFGLFFNQGIQLFKTDLKDIYNFDSSSLGILYYF